MIDDPADINGRAFCTVNNRDRKSTRLNSSHTVISYAVFCLKKKKKNRLLVPLYLLKTSAQWNQTIESNPCYAVILMILNAYSQRAGPRLAYVTSQSPRVWHQ